MGFDRFIMARFKNEDRNVRDIASGQNGLKAPDQPGIVAQVRVGLLSPQLTDLQAIILGQFILIKFDAQTGAGWHFQIAIDRLGVKILLD